MCSWIWELLTWVGTGMLFWACGHSRLCQYRGVGVGDEGDPAHELQPPLPCQPVLATLAGASPMTHFSNLPAPLAPASWEWTGNPHVAAWGASPARTLLESDLVFGWGGVVYFI